MRPKLPQTLRCKGPVELHIARDAGRGRRRGRSARVGRRGRGRGAQSLARLHAQPRLARRLHVSGKAPRQTRH